MKSTFSQSLAERRLSLPELAQELKADGRLGAGDAARCNLPTGVKVHPLVYLAEQDMEDAAHLGRALTMDDLLGWLSEKTGQAVYRIDPLKINVSAVAEVMSRAFAERHQILAVEVHPTEVVIASAEPYVS